uniref:Uncharacterized protein n=1 Tax=Glossina brevipalpis TaxID=37001 RepID=A0A1A9WIV7_9MUSC
MATWHWQHGIGNMTLAASRSQHSIYKARSTIRGDLLHNCREWTFRDFLIVLFENALKNFWYKSCALISTIVLLLRSYVINAECMHHLLALFAIILGTWLVTREVSSSASQYML